jgi:hypothetical protein
VPPVLTAFLEPVAERMIGKLIVNPLNRSSPGDIGILGHKVLDEAGVPMLAGSDSGCAAWEVPGLALHQEFDELAGRVCRRCGSCR